MAETIINISASVGLGALLIVALIVAAVLLWGFACTITAALVKWLRRMFNV